MQGKSTWYGIVYACLFILVFERLSLYQTGIHSTIKTNFHCWVQYHINAFVDLDKVWAGVVLCPFRWRRISNEHFM